jgi:release factor glutamine methyltransferase
MDIRSARRETISQLVSSPTPALDTDVILEYITGKSKSYFISHCDDMLTGQQLAALHDAVSLRQTGLPVAYITGHREFYGLDFCVTRDVLIPKPDTELMVEHVLAYLSGRSGIRAADVCTGSGCIGVSVMHESHSLASLAMTDISAAALDIARKNAARLLTPEQNSAVSFVQGDLLDAVPADAVFDLVLSNPPYIPSDEVTELLKDGRSEPRLALDGDPAHAAENRGDGLAVVRRLIPQAYRHLSQGGMLMIETGEYNEEAAAELMKNAGFAQVTPYRDLAGLLRLTTGIKNQQ